MSLYEVLAQLQLSSQALYHENSSNIFHLKTQSFLPLTPPHLARVARTGAAAGGEQALQQGHEGRVLDDGQGHAALGEGGRDVVIQLFIFLLFAYMP